MITPEVARAAVFFMDRTQLMGNEAMTFLQVRQALMQIANLQQTPQQQQPPDQPPGAQRMPEPMGMLVPPQQPRLEG